MIAIRRSAERGGTQLSWLDSRHTFSFGDYYDPEHEGFRTLRVINDDHIAPGAGFGRHPHRDMEIVTYILEGALEHQDSLGTRTVMKAGDVQRMTAGRGISHSEVNASPTDPLHLLQIWLYPNARGLTPGYEERTIPAAEKEGRWCLIAAQGGRDNSMQIHQDVDVHATILEPGQRVAYLLRQGRHAWLQVARGSVSVNAADVETGDGVAVSNVDQIEVACKSQAELLLFDLS